MPDQTPLPITVNHSKLDGIPYQATEYSVAPAERWQVVFPLDRWDEGAVNAAQAAVGSLHDGLRAFLAGVPLIGGPDYR